MTTCVLETCLVIGHARHSGVTSTEFNDSVELLQGLPKHRSESLSPSFAFTNEETAIIEKLFVIFEREIYFYAYGGEIGIWRSLSFDETDGDDLSIKLELRIRQK